MKKIHLSIPKPCHEDWDAMIEANKGKFCRSCQKTVIDFTGMSDRQLGEFFKKPPSSVCGRVYDDQLNRDIVIPRKRIPWIKYFFRFTWPAFVLFLKSCSGKDNVMGKVNAEARTNHLTEEPIGIVGMMIPEIMAVDTTKTVLKESIVKGELMGDVAIDHESDSIGTPEIDLAEETDTVYKSMDTVFIQSYGTTTGKIMLGGILTCSIETVQEEEPSAIEKVKPAYGAKFKAYPNPVRAGSSLTVSFETSEDLPQLIQILTSSGQLISQLRQNEKDFTLKFDVQIPSNVSSGIYFLRMITKNREVKTTKVIVTK